MRLDKRREPRPCQGIRGNNPTIYQLGNKLARKAVRKVHPTAAAFLKARLASGLSQGTVAERSGYDRDTISRFERGVHSLSVAKFADLCGVVGLVLTVQSVGAA